MKTRSRLARVALATALAGVGCAGAHQTAGPASGSEYAVLRLVASARLEGELEPCS